MVTDLFLKLIIGLMQAFYDMLPAWEILPAKLFGGAGKYDGDLTGSPDAVGYLFGYAYQWNKFVPVDHLVAILSLLVTFGTCLLMYRAARWLIGVVRGAGN